MKKLITLLNFLFIFIFSVFMPTAFVLGSATNLESAIRIVSNLVSQLVIVVFALGLLVFLWGLVTYLAKAGDAEGQKGARGLMLYGVIILFVMASVWGLVSLIQGTFVGGKKTVTPPSVPVIK